MYINNYPRYEKLLFNLSVVGSATAEQLTIAFSSPKQGRDSLNFCIKKGYVESIPFGHEKYYRFYRLTSKGLDYVYSITQDESLSKGSIPKTPHYFETASLYFNCSCVDEFKREPVLNHNNLSFRPDAQIKIKTDLLEYSFLIEHDRRTERISRLEDKFNQYSLLLGQQNLNIIMTVSAEVKKNALLGNPKYNDLATILKDIRKIKNIKKKLPKLNEAGLLEADFVLAEATKRLSKKGYTVEDEGVVEARKKAYENDSIEKLINQRKNSIKELIIGMDDIIPIERLMSLIGDSSWGGNSCSFKKHLMENEFLIGSCDEISMYLNELCSNKDKDILELLGASTEAPVVWSPVEFKLNSEKVKKNIDSGYFIREGRKIGFVLLKIDMNFSDLIKYQKLQDAYVEHEFDELLISVNGSVYKF